MRGYEQNGSNKKFKDAGVVGGSGDLPKKIFAPGYMIKKGPEINTNSPKFKPNYRWHVQITFGNRA